MVVQVKRDRLSGQEIICIDLDDDDDENVPLPPPKRPKPSANDDDDDVVFIDPPSYTEAPQADMDCNGDDVAVVWTRNALVLPHLREDCTQKKFSRTEKNISLLHCEQCYCFVCDVQVKFCKEWYSHCLAHKGSSTWTKRRKEHRKHRNSGGESLKSLVRDQSLFQRQNGILPHRPSQNGVKTGLNRNCSCELCRGLSHWLQLKALEVHVRRSDSWTLAEIGCLEKTAKEQPELNVFKTDEYGLRLVNKRAVNQTLNFLRRGASFGVFRNGKVCSVCSAWVAEKSCTICGIPRADLCDPAKVVPRLLLQVQKTATDMTKLVKVGSFEIGYNLEWNLPSAQNDTKAVWAAHPEWQLPKDFEKIVKIAAGKACCSPFNLKSNTTRQAVVKFLKFFGKNRTFRLTNNFGVFSKEPIELENFNTLKSLLDIQPRLQEPMSCSDDAIDVDFQISITRSSLVQSAFRVSMVIGVYFTEKVFRPPIQAKASSRNKCFEVMTLLGLFPKIHTTWTPPESAKSEDYEIQASVKTLNSGGWASTAVDIESLQYSIIAETKKKSQQYNSIRGLIIDLENRGHAEIPQPDGLTVTLLPFQRQAVRWMLDQEHLPGGINSHLFSQVQLNGQSFMYCPVFGYFRKDPINTTRGGILATEMGMGKTIISVGTILANPPPIGNPAAWGSLIPGKTLAKGTLVVCPVSLVGQWCNECEQKLAGNYRIYRYYGSSRTTNVDLLKEYDIVVTTYLVLVSDKRGNNKGSAQSIRDHGVPPLERLHWWRIILDESHTIKAPNTIQTKSVVALSSLRKWCVTGTPINGSSADIASQLNFLGVHHLGETNLFNNHFTKGSNPYPILSFLRRVILRHSKNQLFLEKRGNPPPPPRKLLDLPPRRDNELLVDMNHEESRAYKALEVAAQRAVEAVGKWSASNRATATFLLHSILRPLRQACSGGVIAAASSITTPSEKSSAAGATAANLTQKIDIEDDAHVENIHSSGVRMLSKVNTLVDNLRRIRNDDPNAKSLVFSQFSNTLIFLQEELPKHDFQYRTLKGDMSMNARARALRDFQEDPPTTIFLISVRAAACGINLTQASHVFLMEPTMNPALQDQAIGRVHRMGQQRCVQIHHVVVRDSVETRIRKLLYGVSKASSISQVPTTQSQPQQSDKAHPSSAPILQPTPMTNEDQSVQPMQIDQPLQSSQACEPTKPFNDITSTAVNADDQPKPITTQDCLAGSLRADNAKLNYNKFAELVGIQNI